MADGGDNNNVFIYTGGNQRVPGDVRYVRVHKSVKIIRRNAFFYCTHLISIEMHDGVEIIEDYAFYNCPSLRRIKVPGVRVIGDYAFDNCKALEDVQFGDKLDTIGEHAFNGCTSIIRIKIPKVRVIGHYAFYKCRQLTDVEMSEDLERIGGWAFARCPRLQRIAIPLKNNMMDEGGMFAECHALSQVDILGGIHKTISSLFVDSWRNEMEDEIDRINQDLPNTPANAKTRTIRQWMERVRNRIEHYKSEHYALLKEFTTLLDLALWKAKLDESQEERSVRSDQPAAKKAEIDMKAAGQEQRITSGANIVIKNVLPFLKLE